MADIVCRKCGSINDFRTEMKTNQNTAWCNGCDAFIKNIPYQSEVTIYVGKYKGQKLSEVEDFRYLEWAITSWNLKPDVLAKYTAHIQKLKENQNG